MPTRNGASVAGSIPWSLRGGARGTLPRAPLERSGRAGCAGAAPRPDPVIARGAPDDRPCTIAHESPGRLPSVQGPRETGDDDLAGIAHRRRATAGRPLRARPGRPPQRARRCRPRRARRTAALPVPRPVAGRRRGRAGAARAGLSLPGPVGPRLRGVPRPATPVSCRRGGSARSARDRSCCCRGSVETGPRRRLVPPLDGRASALHERCTSRGWGAPAEPTGCAGHDDARRGERRRLAARRATPRQSVPYFGERGP
ncbi:MAG: hypothetical protein MZW92_42145 [Comamonadaceae bacterium]|nr:hypothetical protein [Comamonadaceae bacterium]